MQWLNKAADEAIAAHPDGEILVESGGSPSGTHHLGHLRQLITSDAVMLELRRRTTGADLAAAGVIFFTLLAIPVNLYVPGGSFLFTWPPLSLALAVLASTLLPPRRCWLMAMVSIVAFAPAVILVAPLVVQLFTALTLQLAWACSVGVTLTTWLIVSAMALGETKRLQN